MTTEQIKEFVADVCDRFCGMPYSEAEGSNPLIGTGYYTLTSCTAENGATLSSFVDVNLTRLNGNMCFAIYHGADVDSCENLCDPDWEYTESCSEEDLYQTLLYIADMYTEDKLKAMYQ